MSEEVTYATLSFRDSAGAGNYQNRNNLRQKGCRVLSPTWRQAALGLLVLCLMLLIGLVTLGITLLQTESEINSDSERLSQFPQVTHHQQANSSLQPNNSRDLFKEEESLKSQISNLLKRQGKMAVKLCQELVSHISDHKCNPCPKTWHWYQSSCYYFVTDEEKTWNHSRKDCLEKNSTLAKIDSWEEKEFLKSRPLPKYSFFWLGLSWDPSIRSWLWEDGSIPSPPLFRTTDYGWIDGSQRCAYFQNGNIYISRCSAEIFWICEKAAALVKPEDLD